jgi:hypothetical protein
MAAASRRGRSPSLSNSNRICIAMTNGTNGMTGQRLFLGSGPSGQGHLNPPSRFEAILFSARRQVQGLVVLSPSLPTWQWTIWVKSEGRLDAAMVELSGPDPSQVAARKAAVHSIL